MKPTRRSVIKSMLLAGLIPIVKYEEDEKISLNNKIRHSVCKWCYKDISLEELCEASSEIGLASIELLGPEQWEIVNKYDLTCAVGSVLKDGYGISKCFNRKAHHHDLRGNIFRGNPHGKESRN